MAEERILIIKLKQKPCDTCNVIRGCAGSCILESKWYSSITRQEAISRMAKAIYDFEIVACSQEECGKKQCENCETWKWCENIAEAALNDLLEAQNER